MNNLRIVISFATKDHSDSLQIYADTRPEKHQLKRHVAETKASGRRFPVDRCLSGIQFGARGHLFRRSSVGLIVRNPDGPVKAVYDVDDSLHDLTLAPGDDERHFASQNLGSFELRVGA